MSLFRSPIMGLTMQAADYSLFGPGERAASIVADE
jgi:hypothetical protein